MHECPQCGELMERQYAEPDVGITGGWYCNVCEFAELDDEDDSDPSTV